MDTTWEELSQNTQVTSQEDQALLGRVERCIAKIVRLLEEASDRSGAETQEELARMADDIRSSIEQTVSITAEEAKSALQKRFWQTLLGVAATGFTLGFLTNALVSAKTQTEDPD